jgi:hypothetical protein
MPWQVRQRCAMAGRTAIQGAPSSEWQPTQAAARPVAGSVMMATSACSKRRFERRGAWGGCQATRGRRAPSWQAAHAAGSGHKEASSPAAPRWQVVQVGNSRWCAA